MGEVMTAGEAFMARAAKESRTTQKVRDAIHVRMKPLTDTARQFFPRIQGSDEWPAGVRLAVPSDKAGKECYVLEGPNRIPVRSGDWALTNRTGEAIACPDVSFLLKYEECSCE